jgi:A/G-specific adenine glycosylase
LSPDFPATFQKTVLDWFRRNKRDLPWRRTRDPYRIWISEIMLQQTQVKTVLPYYEKFLARFPDVESLASARESEVVAQWSGLGYYSRARNLHRAARQICAGGRQFPTDLEDMLKLPGIGRYTAGAISSIAFEATYPVVDGNVCRFFSRYFGAAFSENECWRIAESLLPESHPGDFNQALMEIGSTLCRPRAPLCLLCPLHEECQTKGESLADLRKTPQVISQNMAMLALRKREKFWLEDRGSTAKLLKNLWCFPVELGSEPVKTLESRLLARFGVRRARHVGDLKHSIMNYRFGISVMTATAGQRITGRGSWVHPDDLSKYPHSSLVRKALRVLCAPAKAKRAHVRAHNGNATTKEKPITATRLQRHGHHQNKSRSRPRSRARQRPRPRPTL